MNHTGDSFAEAAIHAVQNVENGISMGATIKECVQCGIIFLCALTTTCSLAMTSVASFDVITKCLFDCARRWQVVSSVVVRYVAC